MLLDFTATIISSADEVMFSPVCWLDFSGINQLSSTKFGARMYNEPRKNPPNLDVDLIKGLIQEFQGTAGPRLHLVTEVKI